ncbi:MAG TPA: DUF2950 domain-containing protein [Geobacteraceae bacterium]|nr:DUF2950 domain-containing protein [Geobacteraceae bacterium]
MAFRGNMKQWSGLVLAFSLAVLLSALPLPATAGGGPKKFTSPQKAVDALVAAVKSHNVKHLIAIFGPGSEVLVSSGDSVADRSDRQKFLDIYSAGHSIDMVGDDRGVLLLGKDKYPFPFPLLKKGNRWVFDQAAGKEEIINRRIGKNELSAIQVARAYVDAQREYVCKDRDADGISAFAVRFRSSPGKKDGLYWESATGEAESPFGPLVAQAAHEGYGETEKEFLSPYHGYFFRILTAQGEDAEGGAYSYIVNGRMVLGFALIAYPAQYGASGIMTFMVNQAGVVYEKDLGPQTDKAVEAITAFSPDESWKKLQ